MPSKPTARGPTVPQRAPPRLPNKLLFREPIKRPSILHGGNRPIIGSSDQPDRLPRKLRVPFYSFIFAVLSAVLYLADFGTDIFAGVTQLVHGHHLAGILILVLACVTSIFVNVVGYLWAIDDLKKSTKIVSSYRYKRPVWIVGLITQTIPALFSFQSASNCRRFRTVLAMGGAVTAQTVDFYHGVLEADRDATLLFVLATLIQSGPQMLIQAYMLYKRWLSGHSANSLYAWAHFVSITCSLFGLSWALMSQQRCLRYVRQDKENLDAIHCILILSWRAFTLAGRLISLLWFALHFHYWLALLLSVHYVIVFTVIGFYEKPTLAQSTTRQWLLLFGVAWVHLFCPWNVAEGPARWRYAWRYGLECAEFGVVIGLVFSRVDYGREYPVFLAVFCSYVVGLIIMYVYYGCCHPNFTSVQKQWLETVATSSKPGAGRQDRPPVCKNVCCGQCLMDCGYACASYGLWLEYGDFCRDCGFRCFDYGSACTVGFATCGECCSQCWFCFGGPSEPPPDHTCYCRYRDGAIGTGGGRGTDTTGSGVDIGIGGGCESFGGFGSGGGGVECSGGGGGGNGGGVCGGNGGGGGGGGGGDCGGGGDGGGGDCGGGGGGQLIVLMLFVFIGWKAATGRPCSG